MPRLLFDVTRLLQSGLHTGIQRVVRSLLGASQRVLASPECTIMPVSFEGRAWRAYPYLAPHPLEARESQLQPAGELLEPGPGDILLMFDASWYCDPWPAVDAALARGARLCGMIHDLLPLQRSAWFRDGLQERFSTHLYALCERAEQVFVPTSVVRDKLLAVPGLPALSVHVLGHGADFFPAALAPAVLPEQLRGIAGNWQGPLFFMLGTLEPRKNQALVLDAFERLWADGHHARLLFVGQRGWEVEALLSRIDNHPLLGKQLLLASNLDDSALMWLFDSAAGLIYMSRDEGFGLPVLEAARQGCPVICADIPVLHEAGGTWPRYVRPDVRHLLEALLDPPARGLPNPQCRTWDQVAMQLGQYLACQTTAVFPHMPEN
ncbi:glycosyltransferase family 4 protein [Stutzerimonas balearica]|uniref:glycosyltransferase family 4 protein n=1 Tax=Stutzerimonas balearica TaxID=74829 RepID=UPI0028A65C76|nr:glycosyltransferase family 1 protein [Stutzerimonas balearica]